MEIYLLRHGIAEDRKPGRPDSERALTGEGREKLRRVLRRAGESGARPSLVMSSPYRRAVETAAIASAELGYQGSVVNTRSLEPEASPSDTWEELRARSTEPAILVAGHEPHLGTMVAFLLGNPSMWVDMKKGALVRIDCERLGRTPSGILKWMLTPSVAGA
jgi:phosphohistidine phosphatase